MDSEDWSPHLDPSVCITNFKNMRNKFRDIRKYFRDTYGFTVKDIVFNKKSIQDKTPTGTVVVTFYRDVALDVIFTKDKVHNINGRSVKIRPFNEERKSLSSTPMVTNISDKPDSEHASSCPVKRMNWDCWAQVFSHLTAGDIRTFGRSCSCGYNLLRTHEMVRRRSLTLDFKGFHSKGFFCIGCDYTKVKRYLLRYNLSFIQSLTLDLNSLWGRTMDFNFVAFLAKHCPQLKDLCLDSMGVACMKQEMVGVKMHRLQSLVLRNNGNPDRHAFEADCFASVLIAAKNLKSLELAGCAFELPFFGALPRGLEKLTLVGNFNGMPTDVIANRLGHCLKSLTMSVYAQGVRMLSYHESFLKFTKLEELHLRTYCFFNDVRSETVFTPPSLRRLILDKPRNLSSSDISLIGSKSPNLTYLYTKKPCYLIDDVSFLSFSNLEELCIPQSMLFSILTGKLPPSLRRLRLPLKEPMTVGVGDGDLHKPRVLEFFEFIIALPRLEFLETGVVFYPSREFLIERIARRPPGAPFLTLKHGIVRGEHKERIGDRFRFLKVTVHPEHFWEEGCSLMTTFA